jgi:hypothetical protein
MTSFEKVTGMDCASLAQSSVVQGAVTMRGSISPVLAGNANLLLLADILDDTDELHRAAGKPTYSQASQVHECGTPSCALSHWCFHNGVDWLDVDIGDVESDFAINAKEAMELFAGSGCGNALSAKHAAVYLRRFVAHRTADLPANDVLPTSNDGAAA